MNKIQKFSALFFLVAVTGSCSQSQLQENDRYGYLTVGLSDELKDIIEMKAGSAEERIYRLDIYDSKGNLDATVDDYRTVSEENPVRLLMDRYDVHAICGNRGTAFNSPSYGGNASVRIYPDVSSTVDIDCKMSKIKFSTHFPEDDEFKSQFSLYELAVSNGETLTFSSSPKADDLSYGSFADTAYFEVPADKTLTYTLTMVNADGAQYSRTGVLENVAAAEHYHLDFKMGEPEEIDGALILNITLDGEYDAVYTHRLILNFDKTYMPSYSTNSEFEPVPADGSIPVWPLGNSTMKKFIFEAPRGIRNLIISHLDAELLEEGLPQVVDFVDINADDLQIMTDLGITATQLNSSSKSVYAEIDITEFIKNLNISPDNETYYMSLTVIDDYDRYARCDFEFTVVSDIQAETGSYFRWSNFAVVKGRYFSKTPPAGMTFQYKRVSDSDWTEVDPSLIEIDTQTMTFSCMLKGLSLDTEYVYRATSDKDKTDGKQAAEATFKTYATENTIYNLSFDDWVESSGAWYPTSDLNLYHVWDTANEGTASLGAVPTTPEENLVVSGKAAKMVSSKVFGNFAAGNIYTGDFGKATLSPVGATLDWGVPFTSRPLALRGWYRYEPKPIDEASSAYSHLKGTTDICQVQIFLTNWSKVFNVSTGDKRFVDTSVNNPDIIAYGCLLSQDNTTDNAGNRNGYVQFLIPLEYRNLNDPSYIVVSGAASRYGDYFTGGLGSTLYLDELELIYDPDQLTDEEFELVMKGIQ